MYDNWLFLTLSSHLQNEGRGKGEWAAKIVSTDHNIYSKDLLKNIEITENIDLINLVLFILLELFWSLIKVHPIKFKLNLKSNHHLINSRNTFFIIEKNEKLWNLFSNVKDFCKMMEWYSFFNEREYANLDSSVIYLKI